MGKGSIALTSLFSDLGTTPSLGGSHGGQGEEGGMAPRRGFDCVDFICEKVAKAAVIWQRGASAGDGDGGQRRRRGVTRYGFGLVPP